MHDPNPYDPPPENPGEPATDSPDNDLLGIATHWSLVAGLLGVGVGVLSHVFREMGPERVPVFSHDAIFTGTGCAILSCMLLLRYNKFELLPSLVALFVGIGCAWLGMAIGWIYSFRAIPYGFTITRAYIWHEFLKLALLGWNISFIVGAGVLLLRRLPKFNSRSS